MGVRRVLREGLWSFIGGLFELVFDVIDQAGNGLDSLTRSEK